MAKSRHGAGRRDFLKGVAGATACASLAGVAGPLAGAGKVWAASASQDEDLAFSSGIELAAKVARKEISARELTSFFLQRAHTLNQHLNCFITFMDEQALAQADALDAKLASSGPVGPLHGVPIVVKDEDDVEGVVTTYGGAAFDQPAQADSAVVARLRAAGAIILGKTTMPEFGIWAFTESDTNGITHNPWDLTKSVAGSSGGTAASVAAGIAPFGVGGDGGGSIRLPSSWNGLFGLKPTLGRVSAAPNPHLWNNLGVIGCLARSVKDAALFYDITQGSTPGVDKFTAEPLPDSFLNAASMPPTRLRIAISTEPVSLTAQNDAQTTQALKNLGKILEALGHSVTDAHPNYPNLDLAFDPLYILSPAEEAKRADHPERLEFRTKEFQVLAKGLDNPTVWNSVEQATENVKAQVFPFFNDYDVLITPTTPGPAWDSGQIINLGAIGASLKSAQAAAWTLIWNVCGNPAAAVPTGFSTGGLPLSAQLIGLPNSELTLISLAAQIEQVLPWAGVRPPIR